MQYRPEAKELFSAIQDLIIKDILPKIESDDLLSYKALVSWNMLGVLSREYENFDPVKEWKEILDLKLNLISEEVSVPEDKFLKLNKKAKSELLFRFYQSLSQKIRENSKQNLKAHKTISDMPGSPLWNFTKAQLKENLSISNPRFQT